MPQAELVHTVTKDDKTFTLHRLTNDSGASVSICNWGLSIQSIQVPDRDGQLGEVVIGYDDITKYANNPVFLGSTIGRFANRIAKARFEIDGETFIIPANDGPNNLHGGPRGLGHRPWEIRDTGQDDNLVYLSATIASPDGFNGFPGNLAVGVTVLWTNKSELILQFQAVTDAPTVVNLTNHVYFNLAGGGSVHDHQLQLNALHYTPKGEHDIPTGEIRSVVDSPFDFRKNKAIGQDLESIGGYDHNFVVEGELGQLRPMAEVMEPFSGRRLRCLGTQPGVQLFTASFGDGNIEGRGGEKLPNYFGLCLETQHFPDAPNRPEFPSTLLRPGEHYSEKVVYAFGVVQ